MHKINHLCYNELKLNNSAPPEKIIRGNRQLTKRNGVIKYYIILPDRKNHQHEHTISCVNCWGITSRFSNINLNSYVDSFNIMYLLSRSVSVLLANKYICR